jgi:uncharacterized protein (TIGR00251 family)
MNFDRNTRLRILVKANAHNTEVLDWDAHKNALRVSVKEPPDKNKANLALIKFFSKLSKRTVTIVSGKTSKEKVLLFT